MQPNTIDYTFDHDNDGGTTAAVAVALTRRREELDKSTYETGSHTLAAPDTLQFYRTAAKQSGNYYGSQKVSVKRTRTRVVDTVDGSTTKAPEIQELSFSIPIGVTNAQKLASYMELVGFLASDEGKAAMIKLLNVSEI